MCQGKKSTRKSERRVAMIIVSQDRTEIINFDNVDSIWICPDEDGKFTIEATADTNAMMGYYATEERAKEVLQEITKFYERAKRYECSSNNGITLFMGETFTYEMPEK